MGAVTGSVDNPAGVSPAAENATGREAARRPPWLLHIAVLAVPIVLLLVLAWTHRWVAEDAFINFRVIDQFEAGHGPVFNTGDRIEVGTSPAWLVVVGLAHQLTLRTVALSWITVVLGLVCTATALVLAMRASLLLASRCGRRGRAVPLGALLFVVLPPVWDFTTSGLETGLTFLWLAASQLSLVRLYPGPAPAALLRPDARARGALPISTSVLIGLGVLVRPDLAPFCVTFLVGAWVVAATSLRQRVGSLAASLALPVLYEIFRMGYYASLTPNTALAKEAGAAMWSRGAQYLGDYVGTYLLLVPLLALGLMLSTWPWVLGWRQRDGRLLAVVAAPIVGGLVSVIYVVRVGGDFMHARFLLPATFALVLPFACEVLERDVSWRVRQWAGVATGLCWAAVCLLALRTPYEGSFATANNVVNERTYWVERAKTPNPVTLDDYSLESNVREGRELNEMARRGEDQLVLEDGRRVPLPAGEGVAVVTENVGLLSAAAGLDVRIVDYRGLADALGARLEVRPGGRVGHAKALDDAWTLARLSAVGGGAADDARLLAARRALGCGRLPELFAAVEQPMTLGRFVQNVRDAPALTRLRVPSAPEDAVVQLCPGG